MHRNKMSYLDKYKKYKTKYLNLKRSTNKKNENFKNNAKLSKSRINSTLQGFYFIHGTNIKNLVNILETGYLMLPKDVPIEFRRFGKDENVPLDHIFGSIYFNDLKNISSHPGVSLILRPEILQDQDIYFNKGWFGDVIDTTIHLYHDSSDSNKLKQIKKIKKILQKDMYKPGPHNLNGWMTHEILFDKNVPLDKYLSGVVCGNCSDAEETQIKLLLQKYPNVFFTRDTEYFPKTI